MVEVEVTTSAGHVGRGAAPTGQSVGMYEAYVLRDENPDEYKGLSVHKAVDVVKNVIAPVLIGLDVRNQSVLDGVMIDLDGTARKNKLGGNAIYSTSVASLRAAAAASGQTVYQHLAKTELSTIPVPSSSVRAISCVRGRIGTRRSCFPAPSSGVHCRRSAWL